MLNLRSSGFNRLQLCKRIIAFNRMHAVAQQSTQQAMQKSTKKSEATDWMQDVVHTLGREIKIEHRRYSLVKKRKADEHRIVCFMRDERIFPLLSFISRTAKSLSQDEMKEYEEIFAMSLRYSATHLGVRLTDKEWLKTEESTAFIQKFLDMMVNIPICSNDIILVYGLCLARLNQWKSLTPIGASEFSATINELNHRLNQFAGSLEIQKNQLLFNEADFKTVCEFFDFKKMKLVSDVSYLGYDPELTLAAAFADPCPSKDYRGSPFVLTNADKDELTRRFSEQLLNEQRPSFAVKNYARNSVEKPMEKVIRDWRWDNAIASTFVKMTEKINSVQVKLYLRGLKSEDVAEILLECVIAALCQGKNLFPVIDVQFNMASSILAVSHRDFTRKSLNESKDLFEKVCFEYFRYFCEEELARLYTQREWWYICAKKFNVDPNFHIPFGSYKSSETDELGSFLIDVVMAACRIPENKLQNRASHKAFSFRNVNIDQELFATFDTINSKKTELVKMIELHPLLAGLIEEHQFEKLLFPYHMLPMTLPPRPWMDGGSCGPLFSRPSDVLRNLYDFPDRDVNVEMKKRLRSPVQARPVFDALNDLGATPWIINKDALKELVRAFDLSFKPDKQPLLTGLAVPMHKSTIQVPTIHEHFDYKNVAEIPTQEWVKFSKLEYELKKKRNESNSLWCWLMYRIVLANHFRNEILYFPHNMDFRGRVYPISPHLNHMGDDINRCLLKFARGKPLGEKGFDWLKTHCVNLTGLLKRNSIDQRLAFAEENLDKIVNSANYPWAENSWWLQSEEPWQTLAACMEIRDVLNSRSEPRDFVSHLPIHQDGSCNGFQHYAALGRDQQGAMEVNLLPIDLPADIYSNVAVRVEQRRTEDETSDVEQIRDLALDLRTYIPEPMPRKVIKQTVMTTIYGVTKFGARSQIKRQLKALGIPNDKAMGFATYLADKTLGSLTEAFESSMKLKDWFRHCAKTVVKMMQPVEWITPLGLPVHQPYVKAERKFDVVCHLPIRHKQVDAFPPNYVHSLDSVHMMLTTLSCRQRGVTFAAVHDCFWTHASDVDVMNEICREQFINLHKQPIVEDLGQHFRNVYLENPRLRYIDPETLEQFRQDFTPTVKRGTLDIEKIRESVYFFS